MCPRRRDGAVTAGARRRRAEPDGPDEPGEPDEPAEPSAPDAFLAVLWRPEPQRARSDSCRVVTLMASKSASLSLRTRRSCRRCSTPPARPHPSKVVGGGGAGAGVTFGVGRGTESETYGSSMTLGAATMCCCAVAAATIRAGVSSCATASSVWRCALCSMASWCWRAASFTWPLARRACPTTTASSAATTMETDTMVRSRPRPAAVRPPRCRAGRASRDDPERGAPGRRSFCAAPSTSGRAGAAAAACRRVAVAVAAGGAPSGAPSRRSRALSRTIARRRALSDRGLAAISAAEGFRAPRNTSWWRTTAPQTQGRPGGHTHPPEAASANICLVSRSSPEW